MTEELLRAKTIQFVAGFIKDILYKEECLTDEAAEENATIYYDIVEGAKKAVLEEEEQRLLTEVIRDKQAADFASQGLTDASNPTAVDMMGGPAAIDNSTIYKG